jgi:hypothetical protein
MLFIAGETLGFMFAGNVFVDISNPRFVANAMWKRMCLNSVKQKIAEMDIGITAMNADGQSWQRKTTRLTPEEENCGNRIWQKNEKRLWGVTGKIMMK